LQIVQDLVPGGSGSGAPGDTGGQSNGPGAADTFGTNNGSGQSNGNSGFGEIGSPASDAARAIAAGFATVVGTAESIVSDATGNAAGNSDSGGTPAYGPLDQGSLSLSGETPQPVPVSEGAPAAAPASNAPPALDSFSAASPPPTFLQSAVDSLLPGAGDSIRNFLDGVDSAIFAVFGHIF
jgi:hypothetical protein